MQNSCWVWFNLSNFEPQAHQKGNKNHFQNSEHIIIAEGTLGRYSSHSLIRSMSFSYQFCAQFTTKSSSLHIEPKQTNNHRYPPEYRPGKPSVSPKYHIGIIPKVETASSATLRVGSTPRELCNPHRTCWKKNPEEMWAATVAAPSLRFSPVGQVPRTSRLNSSRPARHGEDYAF
jgi:hypothetical protein